MKTTARTAAQVAYEASSNCCLSWRALAPRVRAEYRRISAAVLAHSKACGEHAEFESKLGKPNEDRPS